MWQYLLNKDIVKLDEIHDKNFVLIHMTGLNQSKAECLKSIQNGDLNYFSEVTDNIYIEINDAKAKLIGQSRVNAAVFGENRNTWRLQLTFDVEKINFKWIESRNNSNTFCLQIFAEF